MAPELLEPDPIIVPEGHSIGHRRWIENGAGIIRKELPWEGPADVSITVGSGLAAIIGNLGLQPESVKTIPYKDIGLPIGHNQAHAKELVAGITREGKKVLVWNGRTHAYELPEAGLQTGQWGTLERMELATGYLAMLNEIGAENVILTCAAGGINHPMDEHQIRLFDPKKLPVIGLIGADINFAYPSANMGHYKGNTGDFFGLKDADPELMQMFRAGMKDAGDFTPVPALYYFTSPSTPSFEDPATIHFVAINGGQAVGMSFSYEKQILSGLDRIGRFMGIAVVTNTVELKYKNPSARNHPDSVITVRELRDHYPQEFFIAHPASDQEVRETGKLARNRLGNTLNRLIKSV